MLNCHNVPTNDKQKLPAFAENVGAAAKPFVTTMEAEPTAAVQGL